ncbi:MAG: hypothetical protein QNK27_10125 [Desulfuromusa sp.]|nr:hypothetical protein [Desulfuromusa sp.]
MKYLGEPKKLIEWLPDSMGYPADGWLYIKSEEDSVNQSTMCWPGVVDSIDLSDKEYEEMEAQLRKGGFKSFLSKEQIEDVGSNLRKQLPKYTETQFVEAINYYWVNDAFIEAKSA